MTYPGKLPADFAAFVAANPTLTQPQIAAMFGCNSVAVRKKAERLSIKLPKGQRGGWNRQLPSAAEIAAMAAADPELTISDLIRDYDVTHQTVSNRCRAHGIKLKRSAYTRRATTEHTHAL